MEYRSLEITVVSADDLKDVGRLSKMDVYVVVSLSDDPRSKWRTPVDKDGGKSPKWNHKLKLLVYEAALPRNPSLIFNLRADRIFADKDIGEVTVPVRELLDSSPATDAPERVVEYQVRTPSGKSRGKLKFSYKFGEKSTKPTASAKGTEPVTAYPAYAGPSTAYAHPPAAGYGAPPPPYGAASAYQAPPPPPYGAASAYQAPPPPGYGYPPPGYGYPPQGHGGYPPAGYGGYPQPMMQAPPRKKGNKFGLGLGAGLLGGLLVGDMISDVGDVASYDAGYDAGFDDGFSF